MTKSKVEITCISVAAGISVPLGMRAPLLASTVDLAIRPRRSDRRPATKAETATFRKLAMERLSAHGLNTRLLQEGRIQPTVTATLRAGGGRAIIGRLELDGGDKVYQLFGVAERVGTRYRFTLAEFGTHLPDGDGKENTEHEYIDQLDLDGDGRDEILGVLWHYESWSYVIWRFDASSRRWLRVYEGGGGGC